MLRMVREHSHLIALGAATFFATCIAIAPASLIAPFFSSANGNVSYANLEGTVWQGKVTGLTVSGARVGDVEYKLSALSLLTLAPRIDVSSTNGAVRGQGVVSAGLGGRASLQNASFEVDLGPFAQRGVLGMPVQGVAQVKIAKARLSSRGCVEAEGNVWTDVLEAPARQYRGDGFALRGPVECDGDDLLISLSGNGTDGAAALAFKVTPNFTYELTATAQPTQDDVATALRYFGFEDNDGALIYGSTGVLRGVGS